MTNAIVIQRLPRTSVQNHTRVYTFGTNFEANKKPIMYEVVGDLGYIEKSIQLGSFSLVNGGTNSVIQHNKVSSLQISLVLSSRPREGPSHEPPGVRPQHLKGPTSLSPRIFKSSIIDCATQCSLSHFTRSLQIMKAILH